MASYQQRAIAHYNKKARPRVFRSGTLVLRRVFENTAKRGVGKLQANWQRPYVVTKARNLGAYYLQTLDIVPLLCPCNVSNLIGLACEEWNVCIKKNRKKHVLKIKLFSTRPSPARKIKRRVQIYQVYPPDGLTVAMSPSSRARSPAVVSSSSKE